MEHELRQALERARGCIKGLLARTPVRDVSETLAEIDAALATNPAWQTPIVDAQGDVIPGSNHAPAQGES